MSPSNQPPVAEPSHWDQRYQEGSDGWELGQPAPPLARFLRSHPLAPQPPGKVLVPGCGRGHEVGLLADLGFGAIGLDFSGEALREARRLHGEDRAGLQWLQADLFDRQALGGGGPDSRQPQRHRRAHLLLRHRSRPQAGLHRHRLQAAGAGRLAAGAVLVPPPARRPALGQ